MPTVNITTSTPQSLTANTAYYVLPNQLVFSSVFEAMANANPTDAGISVVLDGIAIGDNTAIRLDGEDDGEGNNFLLIGNTGIARSTGLDANSFAVVMGGAGSGMINRGQISGRACVRFENADNGIFENHGVIDGYGDGLNSNNGVYFYQSEQLSALNTGTITAYGGATAAVGVAFAQSSGVFRNTGDILSDHTGLSHSSASGLRLINSGRIEGVSGTGVESNNGSIIIENDGIIGGASSLDLGLSGNTVVNRGTLDGNAYLGAGNDMFDGASGVVNGRVLGEAGDDTIEGSDAQGDDISGGSDNDMILGRGGDDTLLGGNGNDTVKGNKGDDLVRGGGSADTLSGGRGDDTLEGGNGNDTFVFGRNSGDDEIVDFQDTKDLIDLQALHLSGFGAMAGAITDVAGGVEIDLTLVGGNGTVYIDGITAAQLDAADFIF